MPEERSEKRQRDSEHYIFEYFFDDKTGIKKKTYLHHQ
jgi:hypothetical protein